MATLFRLFLIVLFILYPAAPGKTLAVGSPANTRQEAQNLDQYIYLPLVSRSIHIQRVANHKKLVTGLDYSCAITPTGGVKCWGLNIYGALGNGEKGPSSTPTNVIGLNSGVVSLATGYFFTCALTTNGAVLCWGRNDYGQLGNGTRQDSNRPVNVAGLSSGVVSIAAGFRGACALTNQGTVKCWGASVDGQNAYTQPEDIGEMPPDSAALTMIMFIHTSCVLTSNGAVKCLGPIYVNQSINIGGWTPWEFTFFPPYMRSVELGGWNYPICGVTEQGSVACMDHNPSLITIPGLESGVTALDLGEVHGCAVMDTGSLKCWGTNRSGCLGNDTIAWGEHTVDPVNVVGLSSGVTEVSTGDRHTCAMMANGGVKCWGYNGSDFTLGIGSSDMEVFIPADVIGFP